MKPTTAGALLFAALPPLVANNYIAAQTNIFVAGYDDYVCTVQLTGEGSSSKLTLLNQTVGCKSDFSRNVKVIMKKNHAISKIMRKLIPILFALYPCTVCKQFHIDQSLNTEKERKKRTLLRVGSNHQPPKVFVSLNLGEGKTSSNLINSPGDVVSLGNSVPGSGSFLQTR
jgi:hypothetical protein